MSGHVICVSGGGMTGATGSSTGETGATGGTGASAGTGDTGGSGGSGGIIQSYDGRMVIDLVQGYIHIK